ncbi:MAG: ORF6N domain-containing protein [Deltaproteobacteria bacterium]|nr:ORF6N domain-containing protein [Deltaproteobacteria bacterium]
MTNQVSAERIEHAILLIRGHRVLLDVDLALLYGVSVGRLNEAVKRSRDRFPSDFMFQLSEGEFHNLRAQAGNLNLKSQFAISSSDWGGRRHPPYAFTEQGVAMLSSVLRSKRAVDVNIEIMRTFVRLRQLLATNAELARKLEAMEKKYDAQFKVVFDAIHQLMRPTEPKQRKIGFIVSESAAKYGRSEIKSRK